MAVRDVLDLLACPLCHGSFRLASDARSVQCGTGHVFDIARQGYLNLLGGKAPRNADTAAMVAARDRFLSQGDYRPVLEGLRSLARDRSGGDRRILDAGAGTGYYLAGLLEDGPTGRGLALDVSAAACRHAARSHPRLTAVVADTWQRLPVAEASIDLVVSVFAPRNPAEFARVLTRSGVLITVSPQPDHLVEVRTALRLLDIEHDKSARLEASLSGLFSEVERREIRYQVQLSADGVHDLVTMGPNAFHLTEEEVRARASTLPMPLAVTVAVVVSVWAPRPGHPRR